MSNKKGIAERLKSIEAGKEEIRGSAEKVISGITKGPEKTDLKTIVEKLEERKENMGANEGHVKDTIYIEKHLFDGLKALCVKQGDKKKLVNEAIEDLIHKKYRELMAGDSTKK